MTKKNVLFGVVFIALLLTGCRRGGSSTTSSQPSGTSQSSQTSVVPSDYYSGISENLSGTALLNALNSLNQAKRTNTVGYDEFLNKPERGVYVTDPGASGAKYTVTSFYSGTERKGTSGMNREHVWPKSRGGNLVEADAHMVRPTIASENEGRGNSFYVEGKAKQSGGWDPKAAGLDETFRGDAARIIFYCAIADKSLTIVDKDDDSTGNNTMGKLSDILKWNLQYSVSDREKLRNDGAQSLQGNRNPFLDHPEYACRIWGSTNSTTKSICGM